MLYVFFVSFIFLLACLVTDTYTYDYGLICKELFVDVCARDYNINNYCVCKFVMHKPNSCNDKLQIIRVMLI